MAPNYKRVIKPIKKFFSVQLKQNEKINKILFNVSELIPRARLCSDELVQDSASNLLSQVQGELELASNKINSSAINREDFERLQLSVLQKIRKVNKMLAPFNKFTNVPFTALETGLKGLAKKYKIEFNSKLDRKLNNFACHIDGKMLVTAVEDMLLLPLLSKKPSTGSKLVVTFSKNGINIKVLHKSSLIEEETYATKDFAKLVKGRYTLTKNQLMNETELILSIPVSK
ncbi:MAG: hypothetical protein JW703_03935 [Candidatus Diapherotrites archaeon]|nr:hypothetical protein [Candidatus Diapherotrites archaeon]